MKITMILLRWYKSFNIRYRSDAPPRVESEARPWNAIDVGQALADDYPFIEIPIEDDITTVVGGNESGKSHLISAMSKVLTGHGVSSDLFSQTDFCRYATVPDHNPARWPNIGLHIQVDASDAAALKSAVASSSAPELLKEFTLVLGSKDPTAAAHVFLNRGEHPIAISADALKKIRALLPHVQFLDAEAALPDNLTLRELLVASDPSSKELLTRFSASAAQEAAKLILELKLDPALQMTQDDKAKVASVRTALTAGTIELSADARLAALMFTDILEIPASEIKQVLDQSVGDRGYSEYFLKHWNDRVFERLDLAHFWQQDDQASIELVFKDGTLYFDITDKTGATYTFKERSSGLRYFLSYYIQAKALERRGRDRHAIILMDEPDSFPSIVAQRNLLAVFESLVGREQAAGKAQLIYTTHSPFLINRNYPRRVRVVVKEEAEEGTQFYGRGSSRRFEPVRSALGIDSAQTLFMGATNLVLEGLTDQFFINEMVRTLITSDTAFQCLDLNSVVVVSADGAPNIEKVLAASQWGDEPLPATVVLVDGDEAGRAVIDEITGEFPGKKRLIDKKFCILLSADLHDSMKGSVVETIEDMVPRALYIKAFKSYVQRWHPGAVREHGKALDSAIGEAEADTRGNVAAVQGIAGKVDGLTKDYDKLGVLGNVIAEVQATSSDDTPTDVAVLKQRVLALFAKLNETIVRSQQEAARTSMSTNVKRLVREFVRVRENGCTVLELRRHLQRLSRESRVVHDVGEHLAVAVEGLERAVLKLEQSGQGRLLGKEWARWKKALEQIRRDPLVPGQVDIDLLPIDNRGEAKVGA